MTPQQILVLHGGTPFENYEAFLTNLKNKTPNLEWIKSSKDWKSGLQGKLGDAFVVYTPQFPNKQNAQYEEWKIVFEKIFALLDENPILIGHSLGGIFLVKYFSENTVEKKIKKTILIAAPFDDGEMDHEPLCTFLRSGDLKQFEEQAGEIVLFHSEDDFVVPFSHLGKYTEVLLGAKTYIFKDRNHFLGDDIPELTGEIKS